MGIPKEAQRFFLNSLRICEKIVLIIHLRITDGIDKRSAEGMFKRLNKKPTKNLRNIKGIAGKKNQKNKLLPN